MVYICKSKGKFLKNLCCFCCILSGVLGFKIKWFGDLFVRINKLILKVYVCKNKGKVFVNFKW